MVFEPGRNSGRKHPQNSRRLIYFLALGLIGFVQTGFASDPNAPDLPAPVPSLASECAAKLLPQASASRLLFDRQLSTFGDYGPLEIANLVMVLDQQLSRVRSLENQGRIEIAYLESQAQPENSTIRLTLAPAASLATGDEAAFGYAVTNLDLVVRQLLAKSLGIGDLLAPIPGESLRFFPNLVVSLSWYYTSEPKLTFRLAQGAREVESDMAWSQVKNLLTEALHDPQGLGAIEGARLAALQQRERRLLERKAEVEAKISAIRFQKDALDDMDTTFNPESRGRMVANIGKRQQGLTRELSTLLYLRSLIENDLASIQALRR